MFNNETKRIWGFHPMHDAFFSSLREENPNLIPARVVFSSHDHCKILILGEAEECLAKPRGHFYHQGEELPVVGDWVAVELTDGDHQSLPIESVLPRRSFLRRQDSHKGAQTLIANVDFVAIVTSFNYDLNERRIERGIAMIEDSGAKPIVVINKSDLLEKNEIENWMESLSLRFQNVPVLACSAHQGNGVQHLMNLIEEGQSLAFLGMSGVGKSSLINSMLGDQHMLTTEIREGDSRGRHTTTHRELILSKKGFWIMDTPGIREFAFAGDESSLENAFEDIAELMTHCRFGDCSHQSEPGCRVNEALREGNLSSDRWMNFLKIKKEMEFHAHKNDKAFQSEKKKGRVKFASQLRQRLKDKGRK